MKTKRQIATALRTRLEKQDRTPVFLTANWETRKEEIRKRVARKQAAAHARAVARKEERATKLKFGTISVSRQTEKRTFAQRLARTKARAIKTNQ